MSDSMEPPDADVSGLLSESENEYDDHDPDSQLKEDEDKMNSIHGSGDLDSNGEPKKKYDPKDPMRPRRKKARRACYACQRAHLTCGMSSSYIISLFHLPRVGDRSCPQRKGVIPSAQSRSALCSRRWRGGGRPALCSLSRFSGWHEGT